MGSPVWTDTWLAMRVLLQWWAVNWTPQASVIQMTMIRWAGQNKCTWLKIGLGLEIFCSFKKITRITFKEVHFNQISGFELYIYIFFLLNVRRLYFCYLNQMIELYKSVSASVHAFSPVVLNWWITIQKWVLIYSDRFACSMGNNVKCKFCNVLNNIFAHS